MSLTLIRQSRLNYVAISQNADVEIVLLGYSKGALQHLNKRNRVVFDVIGMFHHSKMIFVFP